MGRYINIVITILAVVMFTSHLSAWAPLNERLEYTIMLPTSDYLVNDILTELEVDTQSFELDELTAESLTNPQPAIFADFGSYFGTNDNVSITGSQGLSTRWFSEGFSTTWDSTDEKGSPYLSQNFNLMANVAFDPNQWSIFGGGVKRYSSKRGTTLNSDVTKDGFIVDSNLVANKGENIQLLISTKYRRDRVSFFECIEHTGFTSRGVFSIIKPDKNLFQIENNILIDRATGSGYYQKTIDTFLTDTINPTPRLSLTGGIGLQISRGNRVDLSLDGKLSLQLGRSFGLFSEIERKRYNINWDKLFTENPYTYPSFPLKEPFADYRLINGFVLNLCEGNSIETSLVITKVSDYIYIYQGDGLPQPSNSTSVKQMGLLTTVELRKTFITSNIDMSILKTRDRYNRQLPYEPVFKIVAKTTISPVRYLGFIIGVHSESARITSGEHKLGGLMVLDTGIEIKPIEEINFNIRINNIFNKEEQTVFNQFDIGRNFTAGFNLSFL